MRSRHRRDPSVVRASGAYLSFNATTDSSKSFVDHRLPRDGRLTPIAPPWTIGCSESTTRRSPASCRLTAAGKASRAVSYAIRRRALSQAETKAQEGDLKGSAANYERALQLSPDSLELFRGYIVRATLCRYLETPSQESVSPAVA